MTPRRAAMRPADLDQLLSRLTADPGRPRLTWYGVDGERIELSGHVLENWVTKTANLLAEEFDVGPRSTVVLDLPAHWRAAVWALATWRLGGTVVPVEATASGADAAAADDPDGPVVVTSEPMRWTDADDLVAVALPGLAREFPGPLPPGALDAAGAVMTYPDVLVVPARVDPDAPALRGATGEVPHRDLLGWAEGVGQEWPATPRVLALATGTGHVLRLALAAWVRDGSLVLAADGAAVDRIATDERVTARA